MPKLKYLGHACFLLQDGKNALIIDPFLTGNPVAATTADQINCQYILVSHGHEDHLGDAVSIAKRTGATIISTAEIARACGEKGAEVHAMHLGGKHSFDFGYVRITPAFHGAGIPGGHACGFIINYYGKIVYHAGDTAIFGDMALLGRLEAIDVALLPIGDNFTMGPSDAAEAANLLQPKRVIPMHYNTWPLIAQSPENFKLDVETRFKIPVQILKPGETFTL
ncbi:MAG: metal-dependent hydrolase [Firmicutes bacterium]|nr:metal-dependent hydrolase [Bacillota bacterium]